MTPRKGDRVRVTYEATVNTRHDGILLVDCLQGSVKHYEIPVPEVATVEVIEDLRPGDVYRDSRKDGMAPEGHTVAYDGRDPDKPWWCATCAFRCMDATVTRPLTLLVRDGRPVTP